LETKAEILAGELILYGVVDPFDGLRAVDVIAALAQSSENPLPVRINSIGGAAYEGLAIYDALRNSGRKIVVRVDAIAASIASVIAMAGHEIVMAEDASMMIHNPYALAMRDAAGFDKAADDLRIIQGQLAAIYSRRSGLPVAKIESMMAAETVMTAAECVRLGFADRVDVPLAIAACAAARPTLAQYLAPPSTKEDDTMTTATQTAAAAANQTAPGVLAERERVSGIYAAARAAKIESQEVEQMVRDGVCLIDAKAKIIDIWSASTHDATGGNHPTLPRSDRTFNNPAFLAQSIEDAIYCRLSGKAPTEAAKEWAGASMLNMGRALLESQGAKGAWLNNRSTLADKVMAAAGMHSTEDFPTLLTGAGKRYLLDTFNSQPSVLKFLAKQRDVDDFRPINVARMSESPRFMEVVEGGEITYATVDETGTTYKVRTFARGFALSRQAVINDDLGAFSDFLGFLGKGASETEAQELAAMFALNSGNGPTMVDGNPLYHTSHANKAASGAALSVTTLGAGRQAMRTALGVDGKTPVGVAPKSLVVGPALETSAEVILATIAAASVDDVNPFSGKLTLQVEPRFSGNAWRLFADPAVMPAIEVAYLSGSGRAPDVKQREGWNTLGIEFRGVHDFGCAATEWRGTYLNAGA
jgi:ATP-dependent protease ClpP protease subunit